MSTVFNVSGTTTLVQALDGGGGSDLAGATRILLRAGVAALLNSTSVGTDYPLTTAQVIKPGQRRPGVAGAATPSSAWPGSLTGSITWGAT